MTRATQQDLLARAGIKPYDDEQRALMAEAVFILAGVDKPVLSLIVGTMRELPNVKPDLLAGLTIELQRRRESAEVPALRLVGNRKKGGAA